jgi:predicted dehydrogenase
MNGPHPLSPRRVGRRSFLARTSIAAAGVALARAPSFLRAAQPSSRFVVGVIGLGRGLDLIRSGLELKNFELAYAADVDEERVGRALDTVRGKAPAALKGVQDFRRVLDDRAVDAVMIATCNHWHAPMTILACKAGKHVYVEKPGSHNAREGEWMVAAARKHERVVQLGTQRRTAPRIRDGIAKLHEGAIGTVRFARSWYNNARPSIRRGAATPVPPHLDYSLWQGPAPERPYVDNLIHYNWHWRWHWGGGELANNGVHALDVVRWGLGVDYPRRVVYEGGRYHHDDDQETPDTGVAVFDFGGDGGRAAKGATWEHSSCHPRRGERVPFVTFYGDGGSLEVDDSGCRVIDIDGKEVPHDADRARGPGDAGHIANWLTSIETNARPNADIEEGQKSALLCHLGNIAYRTRSSVHFDPATRRIVDNPAAEALWGREYRDGWKPEL